MLNRRRLLAAMKRLPRLDLQGPWARYVPLEALLHPPPGAPPESHPQPLWSGGPPRRGQRFTPRGRQGMKSLYLSEDAGTAGIETESVVRIAGQLVPRAKQPMVLLTIEGSIQGALDLTDPETQRALGTSPTELAAEWAYTQELGRLAPTQVLGRAAFDLGVVPALLYPSAVDPGRRNLVVFTDRLAASGSVLLVKSGERILQRIP